MVWKLVETVIYTQVKSVVQFHDMLHGFRHRQGIGTAIIESKLVQQLAVMDQELLYSIFIDLTKAYDTVDRERALRILEGYGIGPKTLHLLQQFWMQQVLVT